MSAENKPSVCTECPKVLCVNVEDDRVMVSDETGRAMLVFDNIEFCPIYNGEFGPDKVLLEDFIWDLTTTLKGWEKHTAFVERIMGNDK